MKFPKLTPNERAFIALMRRQPMPRYAATMATSELQGAPLRFAVLCMPPPLAPLPERNWDCGA